MPRTWLFILHVYVITGYLSSSSEISNFWSESKNRFLPLVWGLLVPCDSSLRSSTCECATCATYCRILTLELIDDERLSDFFRVNSSQTWTGWLFPELTDAPFDRDIARNATQMFGTKQNFERPAQSLDFSEADLAVRLCPESYTEYVSSQTKDAIHNRYY